MAKKGPSHRIVIEVMGNLEKDGLGFLRKQDRTTVFLKDLPCNLQNNVLQAYGIKLDSFTKKFQERASVELLSMELFNKILRMSPRKAELSQVYFNDEEI